ncbi:hypothetical protein BK800_05470 [Klebsiella aerogenes]|nr:hypothetical protein BK800_05470 [Klebsiella aerogenes]
MKNDGYIPVILQVACALAITRPIPGPRPYGRSELRSNSFLTNLSSLTPVTTGVSSWGFPASPPSCNSNYLGYRYYLLSHWLILLYTNTTSR